MKEKCCGDSVGNLESQPHASPTPLALLGFVLHVPQRRFAAQKNRCLEVSPPGCLSGAARQHLLLGY